MDVNKIRNLNSDLCSCLQTLDSHKITERKTKRQEIQRLLENNEVIEVLNYNSDQKLKLSQTSTGYPVTWTYLINCFHRSLILDIEKEDIKRQKLGTDYKRSNLESSSNLLRNIINTANKDQPYIAVNDLLTCILDVSRNETFEFFMGEVYYKILEQNILSQSYYWHTLNSHWKNLFSLACTLYTADFANMKHVSIKIMKHIIERGDAHSSVILDVKKRIFTFIKQAVIDTLQVSNDFSLRDDLIALTFVVCKTIQVECRKSICQFIEENCIHFINLYEIDRPKKVQEILYQLLTLFIKIHHPKCVGFNHNASHYYNKKIWIGQLYEIYEFVLSEVQQSKNNSNPNFLTYISELALTTFNIVYFNKLDNLSLTVNEYPTPKRKKKDTDLLSFINDLTNLKTSEFCIRLHIITKLIEKHSLSITESDYINLLQCITKCFNLYNDSNSTKYLITCCSVLIKSESLIKLNLVKFNEVTPFIRTVWAFILKTIMSHENPDLLHELLQSLIVFKNWNDEMYSDVLRLYFNKTVKYDNYSLKTLIVLFKSRGFCSTSLNKTNILLLFDWLLPMNVQDELLIVEMYSKVNPHILSEVVNLILTKPTINKLLDHNNQQTVSSKDFEDIFFYIAFQDVPKVKLQIAEPAKNKNIRRTVDENICQSLANFIIQSMTIEEKPNIVTLQMFFSLTNFLCFLESEIPHINHECNKFGLCKFNYLDKVKNIASILSSDTNLLNNQQFVKACSIFYKGLQCADDKIFNQILNHEANNAIMNKLYNLSKLNESNNLYQELCYNKLTEEQQMSIETIEVLLNTCLYKGQILTSQSSFLEILIQDFKALEDSMHRPFIYFKFINFLKIVLNSDNLPVDIIIQINKFIKQLAKNWCYHQEGFIQLTLLLRDALRILTKNNTNNVCTSNLLMLIWSLQKIITSKKCGPAMICAFIDLLGHFAYINNGCFGSTWNVNINMVKPMSPKNILCYINSPFLQVRITVIKYITIMCINYEKNPNTYIINYEDMFNIILQNLHEGFIVDSNITEEELDDEYTNRISTYLLCMQSLVISSNKYRQKSLFEIFQTVNDKKIDLNLVINLLERVAIDLKIKSYMVLLENNLNFLLWNWYLKYATFKDFPINLFSCSTIEQFFKEYSFEIVPILVINNDLNLLNSMNTICEVVEEHFPVIYSYLLAIKIGNVPFLNHDDIKSCIENILSQNHFIELIKSQFPDILLKCIQMVVINTEEPILPIQINSDQFKNIINYFQDTFLKNKQPLLTIMSRKQSGSVQKIVHLLYVNIFNKSTPELRVQSFFQYSFFLKMLTHQLLECSDMSDFLYFLVYQSIRSTVTLIEQNNLETQHYALEFLDWLFNKTPENLKLNFNQFQPLVTSTLNVLVKIHPLMNEKLSNLISCLEKMRNQNTNQKLQEENTLQEDIIAFLSEQNESTDINQSLKHLKLKLKTNDQPLQNMYKELQRMRGFSEDCIKSILHRFICKLIQLTNSSDFEIQGLAANCLGILGPADLTTLILQPEPEILKLDSNTSPEYSFIQQIVMMLLNYLSDSNTSVMESSNITLFNIMATNIGLYLYDKLGKSMLYPFKESYIEKQDVELTFNIDQFKLLIDDGELWCPIDRSISYNKWITRITKQLLKILQGFCKSILPIAENKPMFCKHILPYLIYFLLDKPLTRHIINKHLNCFFIKHNEIEKKMRSRKINANSYQDFDMDENNIYCNKSALQCLLNVINFIRHQQTNPLQQLLDINYLYVSRAAHYCSAHFTSILYLELWCDKEFKMKKDHWSMAFNPVDTITELLPEDGLLLQSMLNESYKSIGDPDAVEGCGSTYLLSLSSRTQYYQLIGKWDRVMENCDLQQTTNIISKDYLDALSNSGLHNIAHIMASNNDNSKYDCWQLDKWDLPDNGDQSFEALHYHALRYVHQKNTDSAISMIKEARLVIVKSLSYASLESAATIYSPLAKLKIIEDLEDFISMPDKNILFENWLSPINLRTNEFVNINKILSQRSKLLNFHGDNRSGIIKLNIAEAARKYDCLQEAGRNLASIVCLQNYQKHTILWAKVEEARLLWQRNDSHMARVLLKSVVEELDNYEYPYLHSLALQLYGSWIEETKSEPSSDIIRKYFLKSINILQKESIVKEECGLECKKVLSEAYKHLSQFTDTLYQQLSKYIKTEDHQKRIHEVENDKKKGKNLLKLAKSTNNSEKMKVGVYLMNQCSIDESDISNINVKKTKYLKIALQNYLQLMKMDDESELSIYRIISLWLDNKENNEINAMVDQEFKNISSYKFITVLPQLVAHLSVSYEHGFHKSLENLINRCAVEHPYHTIPIVYAVANSNIDQQYIQCKPSIHNEETRVLSAKRLMSNWKTNADIGSIVINTEKLYEAFIHLAYTKSSSLINNRFEIPKNHPLLQIQQSDNFMYPTATLPLNKYGHYLKIITINRFRCSFLIPGGLHEPKKLDCVCSDGVLRSLLLKGNEDMRQDAVMQQVFGLMNRLLLSNKSTAKRKLTIRTYKVIPFSQQSGIAEWCANTISLGDYLIGKKSTLGAHKKYRPDDMLPAEARNVIKVSRDNRDSQFMKLKKYLSVCENLKPVFRYYFFENFLSPSIWFERRQSYIHSVATTSMVGYILGLGDRHCQNILIDNNTAELIHIDFGVAFEQGTLLNTPETVPFRLSRDIVDGMGICGIEGTFRKHCEKTMAVLRQNQDVIVTVIEVLLYDPCYQWTLTEEKAAQLQNQSTIQNDNINLIEVNKLAERSLNKIRVKLCGMEEAGSAASVNGQVNRLIQQARDPVNLSLLFHGWQAYL